MKMRFFLLTLVLFFCFKDASAQAKQEVLTNSSVVKLFKAGLDNEIIRSKIETSTCKFDVSGDALINLKASGVPAEIIKTMMGKMDPHEKSATALADPSPKKPVQETGMPQPDLINAVYLYNKAEQQVQPLERNTASFKTQSVAFGYGGTNFVYSIPGEKSSVRLKEEDPKPFVVNTGTGPADIFVLYKVHVKKKTRQAIGAKFTLGGAQGSQGVIPVDVKMLRSGVYELIPSAKLEKGEYFFTTRAPANATTSNADVYAFGID